MMNNPTLYRGLWPQNVSRLAKYSVKFVKGSWKITVLYETGKGLRYLAVENADNDLTIRINHLKTSHQDNQLGGAFYVNEYRHVIVPIAAESAEGGFGSHYYYVGRHKSDFIFSFEGKSLTNKPVRPDGTPLLPGELWIGPRPGIPYKLAAGGGDIFYESPVLTEDDPPKVRPFMKRRVYLSKVLGDKVAVAKAVQPVLNIRGHQGGRFYVNEYGAIFTPRGAGDGNGINYVYCGQINRAAWFPEPAVMES